MSNIVGPVKQWWIPATHGPAHTNTCLIAYGDKISLGICDLGIWYVLTDDGWSDRFNFMVTHWMPLPKLPKEEIEV